METKPARLSKGDVIALVSPAGNLPERFKKQEDYSVSYLTSLGYRVKNYINHVNDTNPFIRADTLMKAYTDSEVKAILPICGGEKVFEILNLLDYNLIARNPKIVCGYSFIGALLLAITEKSKCPTFMGPHINFINNKSTNRELLYTVAAFWNLLSCSETEKTGLSNYERACLPKTNLYQSPEFVNIYKNSYKLKQSRQDITYTALNNISTNESIVYAQSLDSLILMNNYNISLNMKNKLLLLDTLDDSFDSITQKLNILNKTYSLRDVEGIIFTSFNERTDKKTATLDLQNKDKIFDFLENTSKIVHIDKLYYGFPMGHCKYKLTIPIGIKAKFDYISGNLIYTESPFTKQR